MIPRIWSKHRLRKLAFFYSQYRDSRWSGDVRHKTTISNGIDLIRMKHSVGRMGKVDKLVHHARVFGKFNEESEDVYKKTIKNWLSLSKLMVCLLMIWCKWAPEHIQVSHRQVLKKVSAYSNKIANFHDISKYHKQKKTQCTAVEIQQIYIPCSHPDLYFITWNVHTFFVQVKFIYVYNAIYIHMDITIRVFGQCHVWFKVQWFFHKWVFHNSIISPWVFYLNKF